jgi:hypothetical protein
MAALAAHLRMTRLVTFRIFLEVLVKFPVMLVGVQWYGVYGLVGAAGLVSLVKITVTVLSVRTMIGLGARAQLLAPWRPLTALVPTALVIMFMEPWIEAPGAVALEVLRFSLVAGAAAATYLASVLILWRASGSPTGGEQIMVSALASRLVKLPGRRGRGAPR